LSVIMGRVSMFPSLKIILEFGWTMLKLIYDMFLGALDTKAVLKDVNGNWEWIGVI